MKIQNSILKNIDTFVINTLLDEKKLFKDGNSSVLPFEELEEFFPELNLFCFSKTDLRYFLNSQSKENLQAYIKELGLNEFYEDPLSVLRDDFSEKDFLLKNFVFLLERDNPLYPAMKERFSTAGNKQFKNKILNFELSGSKEMEETLYFSPKVLDLFIEIIKNKNHDIFNQLKLNNFLIQNLSFDYKKSWLITEKQIQENGITKKLPSPLSKAMEKHVAKPSTMLLSTKSTPENPSFITERVVELDLNALLELGVFNSKDVSQIYTSIFNNLGKKSLCNGDSILGVINNRLYLDIKNRDETKNEAMQQELKNMIFTYVNRKYSQFDIKIIPQTNDGDDFEKKDKKNIFIRALKNMNKQFSLLWENKENYLPKNERYYKNLFKLGLKEVYEKKVTSSVFYSNTLLKKEQKDSINALLNSVCDVLFDDSDVEKVAKMKEQFSLNEKHHLQHYTPYDCLYKLEELPFFHKFLLSEEFPNISDTVIKEVVSPILKAFSERKNFFDYSENIIKKNLRVLLDTNGSVYSSDEIVKFAFLATLKGVFDKDENKKLRDDFLNSPYSGWVKNDLNLLFKVFIKSHPEAKQSLEKLFPSEDRPVEKEIKVMKIHLGDLGFGKELRKQVQLSNLTQVQEIIQKLKIFQVGVDYAVKHFLNDESDELKEYKPLHIKSHFFKNDAQSIFRDLYPSKASPNIVVEEQMWIKLPDNACDKKVSFLKENLSQLCDLVWNTVDKFEYKNLTKINISDWCENCAHMQKAIYMNVKLNNAMNKNLKSEVVESENPDYHFKL